MNYEKFIKALLLKINRQGKEINYETITSYSEKYDAMLTSCVLKLWYTKTIMDEKTGKEKEINWCVPIKFSGTHKYVNIIEYLKKVGDDNGEEKN